MQAKWLVFYVQLVFEILAMRPVSDATIRVDKSTKPQVAQAPLVPPSSYGSFDSESQDWPSFIVVPSASVLLALFPTAQWMLEIQ